MSFSPFTAEDAATGDSAAVNYQLPECGPWGTTVSETMQKGTQMGAAYSEFAWNAAKQEGCHYPCPGGKIKCDFLPSWPPVGKFLYPGLQKQKQVIQEVSPESNPNPFSCPSGAPWSDDAPDTASIQPEVNRTNDFVVEQLRKEQQQRQQQQQQMACGGHESYEEEEEPSWSSPELLDKQLSASLFANIANAFAGLAYDLGHYSELPSDNKFEFVVKRQNRWMFLLMGCLLVLLVVIIVVAICLSIGGSSSSLASSSSPFGRFSIQDYDIVLKPKVH